MFEGNASYLYVADVARGTDTLDGMAPGSVAIVDEQGAVLTGATVSGKARVAVKLADGQLIYSPEVDMATRKNTIGKEYAAAQQQVSYLGFNGSDGELDAEANKSFVLHIEWKNSQFVANNSPISFSAPYHTVSASQQELATGLLGAIEGVISRQPYNFIKVERVSNGTKTNLTNGAVVVNGLKGVTSTAHGLTAGDLVSLNDATYVVASVEDANNFTLDAAYAGADETIAAGANAASLATVTKWGIKFTGQEAPKFSPVNDTWTIPSFDLVSGDFVTAKVTKMQAPTKGSGNGKEIASIETYAQFLDKHGVIGAFPEIERRQTAIIAGTYDIMSFEVSDKTFTSPTTGMGPAHSFRIQIATAVALNGDDVDTVLGVSV